MAKSSKFMFGLLTFLSLTSSFTDKLVQCPHPTFIRKHVCFSGCETADQALQFSQERYVQINHVFYGITNYELSIGKINYS